MGFFVNIGDIYYLLPPITSRSRPTRRPTRSRPSRRPTAVNEKSFLACAGVRLIDDKVLRRMICARGRARSRGGLGRRMDSLHRKQLCARRHWLRGGCRWRRGRGRSRGDCPRHALRAGVILRVPSSPHIFFVRPRASPSPPRVRHACRRVWRSTIGPLCGFCGRGADAAAAVPRAILTAWGLRLCFCRVSAFRAASLAKASVLRPRGGVDK